MNTTHQDSECKFKKDCHFYNIPEMTPHTQHLKELYCIQWPQRCEIYIARVQGKPVPITLLPSGKAVI